LVICLVTATLKGGAMKKKLFIAIILVALVALLFLGSAQIYQSTTNLQVKGWLFGKDNSFAGERTWGTNGTADTLTISGVDTTCVVFLTPKTATGTLRYDIATAGGSIFVTSTGSETGGTDKYSYMIIRNGYGATD